MKNGWELGVPPWLRKPPHGETTNWWNLKAARKNPSYDWSWCFTWGCNGCNPTCGYGGFFTNIWHGLVKLESEIQGWFQATYHWGFLPSSFYEEFDNVWHLENTQNWRNLTNMIYKCWVFHIPLWSAGASPFFGGSPWPMIGQDGWVPFGDRTHTLNTEINAVNHSYGPN